MEEIVQDLKPNKGKSLVIDTDFGSFARYPVKTHVVKSGDSLDDILLTYVGDNRREGDIIFMSEKIVAISQGRAFPIDTIKPRRMARILSKFVYKSPYGIGLGIPETMELAIRELGIVRILFAAFCSAVTKPFGIRGVFYRICGEKARAIDGPCDCTIPPYNHYAKLAPDKPDKVAAHLSEVTGNGIVVIDANDLGVEVLGRSSDAIDIAFCKQVFKDNPLDQGDQQTPLAIVRKLTAEEAERIRKAESAQKAEESEQQDGEASRPECPKEAEAKAEEALPCDGEDASPAGEGDGEPIEKGTCISGADSRSNQDEYVNTDDDAHETEEEETGESDEKSE